MISKMVFSKLGIRDKGEDVAGRSADNTNVQRKQLDAMTAARGNRDAEVVAVGADGHR